MQIGDVCICFLRVVAAAVVVFVFRYYSALETVSECVMYLYRCHSYIGLYFISKKNQREYFCVFYKYNHDNEILSLLSLLLLHRRNTMALVSPAFDYNHFC